VYDVLKSCRETQGPTELMSHLVIQFSKLKILLKELVRLELLEEAKTERPKRPYMWGHLSLNQGRYVAHGGKTPSDGVFHTYNTTRKGYRFLKAYEQLAELTGTKLE